MKFYKDQPGVWCLNRGWKFKETDCKDLPCGIRHDDIYDYTQNNNSLMLYPQSLTDAKITVKYKTEKDNATFFNGSKEVALTGEWTNGQSIRYILTLPVGAEKMSVNTTNKEEENATDNEQNAKAPEL